MPRTMDMNFIPGAFVYSCKALLFLSLQGAKIFYFFHSQHLKILKMPPG
jgi:hypothetical protein